MLLLSQDKKRAVLLHFSLPQASYDEGCTLAS